MKKKSNAWLGYEHRKTKERSGVAIDYTPTTRKNGQLVETNQRYRIYYFATEHDFDQWQKKRLLQKTTS